MATPTGGPNPAYVRRASYPGPLTPQQQPMVSPPGLQHSTSLVGPSHHHQQQQQQQQQMVVGGMPHRRISGGGANGMVGMDNHGGGGRLPVQPAQEEKRSLLQQLLSE